MCNTSQIAPRRSREIRPLPIPQSFVAHPERTKLSAPSFVASHWVGRCAVLHRVRASSSPAPPPCPLAYALETLTPCACSAPQRQRAVHPRENGYPQEQPPSLRHFPSGPPALWRNTQGRFFVSRKMLFSIPLVFGLPFRPFMNAARRCYAGRLLKPKDVAFRGRLWNAIMTCD